MSIFTNSERQQVFYDYGTFDASRKKYVKAPFDLMLIGNDWCIVTASGESNGAAPMAAYASPNTLVGDAEYDTEAFIMGREEGWHSLAPVIVEPHQMGNGAENGWRGCHQFGWI